MLPVYQADDAQVRVGRPGNDDIARLQVGMADAEMTDGGVAGDQLRHDAELAVQVLDMVRR